MSKDEHLYVLQWIVKKTFHRQSYIYKTNYNFSCFYNTRLERRKVLEEFVLYTIEEVMNILKVTRRTVYNYIKNGDVKAIKIGKYWRISHSNLQDFIDTCEQRTSEMLESNA
jgi:excisionase family DNA binding protein